MGGGAAVDLNLLLERVMMDPVAVVERVLQQVVDQLVHEEAPAGAEGAPPEELVATAVGNRLARLFTDEPTPAGAGDKALAHHRKLADRNAALAAALGACDCWGQQPGCPICDGDGAPGWALPDERLFASYVGPAARAIANPTVAPPGTASTAENPRREQGDVQ